MADPVGSQPKKRIDSTAIVESKWVTVYKDRILSNDGSELEYWHVNRSDTVIVLVRQGGNFVLTDMQFRPGIDMMTLDFPGGRIDDNDPLVAAKTILYRELQISDSILLDFKQLTDKPLFVDSSFSSQKVFGFYVELPGDLKIAGVKHYTSQELVEKLQCLQCRALLDIFLLQQK